MTEATATVKPARKLPAIWLVPIVAALLGIWVVIYTYMNEGPTIEISFSDASGVEEGKTKIKMLEVELGVVESVELMEDLQGVVMTAKLERFARPLLKEDTRFWVVRPRVGPTGVSGLGTILSGGYIKLAAGTGETGRRQFVGLDDPPITPPGTPGLTLNLTSAKAGSVTVGNPVLFRGYRVGEVDSAEFDVEQQRMTYTLFIKEPFDSLVTQNTRFWNSSGISLQASAGGLKLEVGSLQTVLIGGVAFDLPNNTTPGQMAQDGDRYALFPNRDAIEVQSYDHHADYVVSFSQSVSGIRPGTPVEYRGFTVGSVQRILIKALVAEQLTGLGGPIPVLIRLEPGRMGLPDTQESVARFEAAIQEGVKHGLRASHRSGNLLTGSSLVSFEYHPEQGAAELGSFAGYTEIPTISGGIMRIGDQVSTLLAKLNALPLEPIVRDLDATLVAIRDAVENLNGLLGSDDTQALPSSVQSALLELNGILDSVSPDSTTAKQLNNSLQELTQVLRNLESVTRTLSDQPSTLIFSQPIPEDPVPTKRSSP